MRVTKFTHSRVLIETGPDRILFDQRNFSFVGRLMRRLVAVILFLSASVVTNAQSATGFVNVRDYGVTGNGKMIDGPAIQAVLSDHPNQAILFPAGTYLLNNASRATGLTIPKIFHGTIHMASGARFACNTFSATAGFCLLFNGNSAIQLYGVNITYPGYTGTLLPRNHCGDGGILVQSSSRDITFHNLTIESSPGVGVWNTDSIRITYYSNTRITHTSADGWHAENCSSCGVDGYYSLDTGDDAIAFTNITPTGYNTGGFARNAHIYKSHARGVLVAGQNLVIIDGIYINGTGYSGVAVIQDRSINSDISNAVKISNVDSWHNGDGTVSLPAGTAGNGHCFEIGVSTNTTLTSVSGHYCGYNGLFAYSVTPDTQTGLRVTAINIDHATKAGIVAAGITDFRLANAATNSDSSGGIGFENVTDSDASFIKSTADSGYGIFVSGANRLTGTNWEVMAGPHSGTNGGRIMEIETPSGPMHVDHVIIADTQIPAKGFVLGAYRIGAYPVVMTNIINYVADKTKNHFTIESSGGPNELYTMQGAHR